MSYKRRDFLKASLTTVLLAHWDWHQQQPIPCGWWRSHQSCRDACVAAGISPHPVIIESIELLKSGKFFIVRARSKDGVVGIALPNEKIGFLYPMLLQQVIPFSSGKMLAISKHSWWSVCLWQQLQRCRGSRLVLCGVVEFCLLDLLGKTAQSMSARCLAESTRPYSDLRCQRKPWDDTGRRGEYPAEADCRNGAHAVKFKVGGRMSRTGIQCQIVQRASLNFPEKYWVMESRFRLMPTDPSMQPKQSKSANALKRSTLICSKSRVRSMIWIRPNKLPMRWRFQSPEANRSRANIVCMDDQTRRSSNRSTWSSLLRRLYPCYKVARMAAAANIPITTHISSGNTDMPRWLTFLVHKEYGEVPGTEERCRRHRTFLRSTNCSKRRISQYPDRSWFWHGTYRWIAKECNRCKRGIFQMRNV